MIGRRCLDLDGESANLTPAGGDDGSFGSWRKHGSRYLVRISRNLPFRGSPLGPFDDLLPPHLSLPVLVAANLYARGRTGWSIQIIQPETAWRAERVIFTEKVRGGAAVADTAIALANSVHQGARPWEEPRGAWFRVKQYMNWG